MFVMEILIVRCEVWSKGLLLEVGFERFRVEKVLFDLFSLIMCFKS